MSSLVHTTLGSSSLHSVGYSAEATILEIVFCNGSKYCYFDVPAHIYNDLLTAESKGRYFTAAIRTRFAYQRLQ